jgi:DNA-binding transcriptional regulator LsrR (DeoR family)
MMMNQKTVQTKTRKEIEAEYNARYEEIAQVLIKTPMGKRRLARHLGVTDQRASAILRRLRETGHLSDEQATAASVARFAEITKSQKPKE